MVNSSSINLFPTFQYSQPEAYHFSHDSVFLARRVFEYIQEHNWQPQTALDLCAGCGVVGMDLLFHLRSTGCDLPKKFDFLEIQNQYEEHFKENFRRLGEVPTECRFVKENYAQITNINLAQAYDLIVCNPPYFSVGHGKPPANDLKLRSRFFVDSDLATLIEFIFRKLSVNGSAFVLIRNQLEHGKNQLAVIRNLCEGKLKMTLLADIRGTHFGIFTR